MYGNMRLPVHKTVSNIRTNLPRRRSEGLTWPKPKFLKLTVKFWNLKNVFENDREF
jgi:hypothetical protein